MPLDAVLVAAALAVTAANVAPLLRGDAWWIRIFDFPRVQLAILSAVLLVPVIARFGLADPVALGLSAALLASGALQLAHILPYTPLAAPELRRADGRDDDNRVRLLIVNVLMSNRNDRALRDLIADRDPDIVLTVETDHWWQSALAAIEAGYPHRVAVPLGNFYGMHLYSRLPLRHPQVSYLVEDEVPSIHAEVVLRSGRRVRLHGLHPAPPAPNENPRSSERDAELLIVARTIARGDGPAVVMGDLNDVAWSRTTRLFCRLGGMLDPRRGRGLFSTFHARLPFLRWPLDHVFCTPDFTLVALRRLPAIGSDHFPIEAVLQLEPAPNGGEPPERLDAAEHDDVHDTIDRVGADRDALDPPRTRG